MKKGMTQNQQMNFVVKCKTLLVIFLFRNAIGRGERFAETFHPTPFSASNHILYVTVVYIVYSRIIPLGIDDTGLSDF
jgi:hypothetical protein